MKKLFYLLLWLLKTRRFTDKDALCKHQEKQLKRLFASIEHGFYPNKQQLADFPIINKKLFMANFQQINRFGISAEEALAFAVEAENSRDFSPKLRQITVGLSSGTSGNRGLFLASDKEVGQWAGYMLKRMLPRPLWQKHRIAFFLRANSNLYESVKNPWIDFTYFDLLKPLEQHINALNQMAPTIVIAPAQVLVLLAQSPQLSIQPIKIISVAEVLEAQDKALIEARFKQVLHQVYQCTEGFLAHTCEHGNLHLNEDIVLIEKEFIDQASGRFVPIVTDFNRMTQPVIRYRLDDILQLDNTPCACGSAFTRIKKIEGRCDDILHMQGLNGEAYRLYPDFIRNAVIAIGPALHEYCLIKHGQQLLIHLEPLSVQPQLEQALQSLYQKHQLKPLAHHYLPYTQKPLDQKRRRVFEQ